MALCAQARGSASRIRVTPIAAIRNASHDAAVSANAIASALSRRLARAVDHEQAAGEYQASQKTDYQ